MTAALPTTWRLVKVCEIATLVGGGTPSRQISTYFDGYIPWLTGYDLPEDHISVVDTGQEYITDEAVANSATSIVPARTVLLTTRVTVGKVAVTSTPLCFSQDLTGITVNNDTVTDPYYMAYCLYLNRKSLLKFNRGTTIQGITRNDVAQLQIPLPPLPEQQRIVTVLRQADELRLLRADANARLQDLVPALFYEMFGEPKYTWTKCKLSQLIRFEAGKSMIAENIPARPDRWGILKVSAVTTGEFKASENKELPEDAKFDVKLEVKHGDFLVSRANTEEYVGASAIAHNPPPRLIIPDKLWRVVPLADVDINFNFLHALFSTKVMRKEISRRATGTSSSMKNISQEKFLDIEIELPPSSDQHRFGSQVEIIRNEIINSQGTATAKLANLFNSLLIRSFNGELTTVWREAHHTELEQAARKRDELLSTSQTIDFTANFEAKVTVSEPVDLIVTSPTRALQTDFDPVTQTLLRTVQAKPAYFRVEELVVKGLNALQAEAGLHLLEALGFVRQVQVMGQLLWRCIDPVRDGASKPLVLA